jgi:putative peptide maturation system protein
MILIVAAANDDHVAAVLPELRRRGASVLLLDLAELPVRAQLSVAYQQGLRAQTMLRLRDQEVDLGAVTAVWSRPARAPSPDAEITSEELRDYVRQETADAWIGASSLLDCLWLPAPHWQELRASYKPIQLQMAADLGFEIPPTLVTNNPQDFLDFYRRHNGAVITKTVHNRLLPANRPNGYDAYAITELVANRDLVDADAIRYCPVTVQPYVDKRVELRITVVGDRVFPVELDSQWTNHTRHDWRRSDYQLARYKVHNLPPVVEQRCVELVKRLGLLFGAIDLILTADGRYVFLEINPNGEWLWMEQNTGLPIGAAVSDLLAGEAIASSTRVTPTPSRAGASLLHSEADTPTLASRRPPARRTDARISPTAVAATLKYLGRLAREGTPPGEAVAGLCRLAKRHRGTQMELVWEVESSYFGTFQYDALLRMPGGGSLSLAFSPKGRIPWALRHAHHARETDLLRVNGRTLNMQIVMGYLDGLWSDSGLLTALVNGCLVREAVNARGLEATVDEIRNAAAAFERRAGLTSVEARDSWLQGRGWTLDDFKYEIGRLVTARKLRRQIASGKIDAYFIRHRRELDTAVIARLRFDSHEAAYRFARRIKRSTLGLGQAMEEAVLAGETNLARGEFATVRRQDFIPAHAKIIFAASPGQVLGPFERAGGHDVVRVLRIARAELDESTRERIMGILFEEYLAKRRSQATVEWLWGDVERAPRRAGTFGWLR